MGTTRVLLDCIQMAKQTSQAAPAAGTGDQASAAVSPCLARKAKRIAKGGAFRSRQDNQSARADCRRSGATRQAGGCRGYLQSSAERQRKGIPGFSGSSRFAKEARRSLFVTS